MSRQIESNLQQLCVRWFRYQYYDPNPGRDMSKLLIAVPNGGARSRSEGARLKREGVVAGVADLILFVPADGFHALCIEMKTEEKFSKQRATQKEWQALVERMGYKYVVCRSFEEFAKVVENHINHYNLQNSYKTHGL